MPTYVYRREDGSTFEVQQRITEDPLKVDPETGQKVERVISGAGLIFKGSGFYLTDYARGGSNGDSSADASSGESKESSSETATAEKSDTSSETKSKPKPSTD